MGSLRWTWHLVGAQPQEEVFATPDDALNAMQKRIGKKITLQELWEMGFALALVTVKIEVHMVLCPHPPSTLPLLGVGL